MQNKNKKIDNLTDYFLIAMPEMDDQFFFFFLV